MMNQTMSNVMSCIDELGHCHRSRQYDYWEYSISYYNVYKFQSVLAYKILYPYAVREEAIRFFYQKYVLEWWGA